MGILDSLEKMDHLVKKDRVVYPVSQVQKEQKVNPANLVCLEDPVKMASPAFPDSRVSLAMVNLDYLVFLAPKVMLVYLAFLVNPDNLGRWDHHRLKNKSAMEKPADLDHRVCLD